MSMNGAAKNDNFFVEKTRRAALEYDKCGLICQKRPQKSEKVCCVASKYDKFGMISPHHAPAPSLQKCL